MYRSCPTPGRMADRMRVLGIGDNVCDMYIHKRMMYPGGQALNVAVYAHMLGVESAYLGVFGTDEVAAHVQRTLTGLNIPFPRCRTYPGENGYALVTLTDGDRVFLGSNRGGVLQGHYLELNEDDWVYLSRFSVIHTTNNAFFDHGLPTLRGTGALVSYDFSTRWTERDRVERTAPYIDVAFLSCGGLTAEEIEAVCRDLVSRGIGTVCATCGSQGAAACAGRRMIWQPAKLVQAVDTMGAGDSFAAAVMVELGRAAEHDGRMCWQDPAWREAVLPGALEQAAAFSARICLLEGAFGHGIVIPETIKGRVMPR